MKSERNLYTLEGMVIWDDLDPTVVGIKMRGNKPPIVDLTLQQTLAQIWRDHGNLTPVRVTIEVIK